MLGYLATKGTDCLRMRLLRSSSVTRRVKFMLPSPATVMLLTVLSSASQCIRRR